MSEVIPISKETATVAEQAWWKQKGVIAVAVALVVAAAGTFYIVTPKSKVTTDNAYIGADSSVIAPKVRGTVAEVLVSHNQSVKRGDPLLRIDAEEFDAKVASAEADRKNAQAALAASKAALNALTAEEQLAASTIRAAESAIRSADAQRDRASADNVRYLRLVDTGAVARINVDQYRAVAISADADAERSRAQLDVSRNQATVIHARRQTLLANVAQSEAAIARADAALELAKQDQSHTLIVAPLDGVVGDRQVEQGDFVQPGSRLLTIVPMKSLYVVANFKETQTARMTAGQIATIEVDALPGVELKGSVESLAPGSGSQFSLLPFEPGTGNFTKIVQRVPVRILFDRDQPQLANLRPGLSTTVTVRLN